MELGREVGHGTAFCRPLDVKLALERRFREPLDVKLALERRFSGALGRQVGLGFGAKAGRAGKAGVEGVLKGLFKARKALALH